MQSSENRNILTDPRVIIIIIIIIIISSSSSSSSLTSGCCPLCLINRSEIDITIMIVTFYACA